MFYGMNAWFLATLVLGAVLWVAGAALPAWRKVGGAAGAQAYVSAWSRGGPVLALLTLASAGLGLAAAFDDADAKWAVGAGFMAAAIAYTVALMGGVGHRLRDRATGADPNAAAQIDADLRLWARLHLGRCLLVFCGVFFFIWAAH